MKGDLRSDTDARPMLRSFVVIGIAESGRVGVIAVQECDRCATGAIGQSHSAPLSLRGGGMTWALDARDLVAAAG